MRRSAKRRAGRNGFGVGGPSRKEARQDRIRPWQSLAVRAPELVAELHPTRNADLDPARLAWAANRRVWWRCRECGHEWRALVSSRTAGSGCPECGRRRGSAAVAEAKRRVPADRSVVTLRKDLLAIWDEELTGGLDPASVAVHSSQRVWWRCPACDRRWQATVDNRSRAGHYVCPACARRERARATPSSVAP
jgi:rubrerythrin